VETINRELIRVGTGNNMSLRLAVCALGLWIMASLFALTFHEGIGLKRFWVIDWALSKPLVAGCGLLSALMGIVTAVGALYYVGYEYISIVEAMPFLVIGTCRKNHA